MWNLQYETKLFEFDALLGQQLRKYNKYQKTEKTVLRIDCPDHVGLKFKAAKFDDNKFRCTLENRSKSWFLAIFYKIVVF